MSKTGTSVTVVEKRRARKADNGRCSTGDKVVCLTNGNTYLFINGKPGKNATVVTEKVAKLAVKRKQEDEAKNPMLAGNWHQYVLKTEKLMFFTNDLIQQDAYKKAISTDANKGILKKLQTAETKRTKLQEDLAEVGTAIKSLNTELIATIQAEA